MSQRFLLHNFIRISLFAALSSLTIYAQEPPPPQSQKLILSQTIDREIKGGERHFYAVQVEAGQTARVEVEQKGVDVSLAAYLPAGGEKFIESESPSGLLGADSILVTAAGGAGEYRIEVNTADPKAAPGRYAIKLSEIRPTAPQDAEINRAAMKIIRIADETVALRQTATRASRRQALEKFAEIAALSNVKRDKVWEAVALITSGLIHEQMGELQSALDFYLRGLNVTREAGNRQYEGTALNNLGAVNYLLGEYETAIFYYDQALRLQRETKNLRGEAVNLNNLGLANLLAGKLPGAQEFFRRSLAVRREIKDRRGEANTLNNLGLAFAAAADRARALDFLRQALAARREIGDRQGEAVSLRNLGKTLWEAGDRTEAFENFRQANALAKELGDRRVEADSFYWLAVAEKEKGNLPRAVENIENGLRIIEQIRGEFVSLELRTAYFSTVQQFYELYADLLVSRYERSKDPADAALALEISERARARSFVELLQEARVNVKEGIDARVLERLEDLQDALNARYRQRAQLLSGKPPTAEQTARITGEINSLAAELENLQIKIRRENPRYAALSQAATAPAAAEIQNLLDDETVLLEYKLGESRSFLWLVTKNSTAVFTLPPRREIETAAKELYALIAARGRAAGAAAADETPITEASKRLGGILLTPVAAKIAHKRLAIVADGALQFIPFGALSVDARETAVGSQVKDQRPKTKDQFLIESNEIVVLPSAGVLAELRRNVGTRRAPEKSIAVFADPIFEPNDARLSAAAAMTNGKKTAGQPPLASAAHLKAALRDFNFGETLPRLLHSRVEARNIVALLPKNEAALNIDFEASRENAMNESLANYRILHFATHGLLDASRPALSGLVFSLYDRNGNARDGFLSLNQIYNLRLAGDLVTLSACQTALGKDVRGEGLIGLTRGFMYAGVRRVAASLWKVDDAATAEFMRRFYENLLRKNLPPVAALREAQNEMRRTPRFRAPYFWAAFTIQGDWRR